MPAFRLLGDNKKNPILGALTLVLSMFAATAALAVVAAENHACDFTPDLRDGFHDRARGNGDISKVIAAPPLPAIPLAHAGRLTYTARLDRPPEAPCRAAQTSTL